MKSSDLSLNCFRQKLKTFYFVNIDTSPSTTRDIVDALYKSMILTYRVSLFSFERLDIIVHLHLPAERSLQRVGVIGFNSIISADT